MKHSLKKLLTALVLILILASVGAAASFAFAGGLLKVSEDGGAYLDNPDINTPDIFPGNDMTDENEINAPTEYPSPENSPQEDFTTEIQTKDTLLKATVNTLNIRSGPGTAYATVGAINAGDMLPFVAEENSKWYKTLYKGKTAYVSSSLVQIVRFDKASEVIEKVIDEAKKLLGFPYIYGAQRYHWGTPNATLNKNFVMGKFDCSSLTQYAFYKGANIILDTTTRTQVKQGKPVERQYLKRGDLMFFTNSSRAHLSGTERIGHVAIYLGDNYIIHTASDYAVIEPITASRWKNYITSRRVLD